MSGPARVLRVGLTGGIASGKSEVARELAACGALVIDADEVAHALLASDAEAIREISAVFGAGVLGAGGSVDRPALGRIVFHDAEARDVLNRILHPRIRAEIESRIDRARREGTARIVVVDAALLVETGYHREFDRVVVVSTPTERQIRHLTERDGLSRAEALARIAAQWPTEAKAAAAHHHIVNDGSLEEIRRRARELHAALLAELDRDVRPGGAGR